MTPDRRLWLHQCASPSGDIEAAFAEIGRGLSNAAASGAVMAVFPELMLPGYNTTRVTELAEPRDGGWVARLRDMAARAGCGVTLGYAERVGADCFNSAVAIDATGAVLGHYRKIQLYGPREAALFRPGDAYTVFDWLGVRTALLICYDIEFAGHVRALASRGVELILCPTANMTPFDHVSRVTVPSQAVNHALAIAYVNYCGSEGALRYCGGSVFVAADGKVLAVLDDRPGGAVVNTGSAGPGSSVDATSGLSGDRVLKGPSGSRADPL